MVPTRNSASTGVANVRSPRSGWAIAFRLRAEPPGHLGDQRSQSVGQHRHLLLLAGHRQHPAPVDDLEEELAFAGLPDGPGKEPLG